MTVTKEQIDAIVRVSRNTIASGIYSDASQVIVVLADENAALRKVADATVAFMNAPYSNDEKELNELGGALTEAGL